MNIHFANFWVLHLIWLAPLAGIAWHAIGRRRVARLDRFVSPAMRAKLAPPSSGARALAQNILVCAGLMLGLIAAARPQWGTREETVVQRGRDLMVVLDVSRSMLATDVHPNRLQRAKADIFDLVHDLKGDRVGLMAFRRRASVLCPLTTDYAYFLSALEGAGPWSAPRGETDMGDAILKALDAFGDHAGTHRAIVLVSDGEDLSGRGLEAAGKAAERGVAVFTVGLGNRNGAKIPDEAKTGSAMTYRGEEIMTRLDNENMLAIARATGGVYIPLEVTSTAVTTLGRLYNDHLRKVSARDMEESLMRRRIERFHLFLIPAVALFLAAAFLSRGRLAATSGARAPAAAALCLLALCGTSLAAEPTNTVPSPAAHPGTNTVSETAIPSARKAWRLYSLGRHSEAADAYLAAASAISGDSERLRYNAAVSLYRAGRHSEAAELFRALALRSPRMKAESFHGLGASLEAQSRPGKDADAAAIVSAAETLKQAADAFREGARLERKESSSALAAVAARIPEAEEAALIARLTERFQGAPPDAIASEMLAGQRAVAAAGAAAFTNVTPARITALEEAAAAQKATADLWIPLKAKLLDALAASAGDADTKKRAAQVAETIEITRDRMNTAAGQFRDMDPTALSSAAVCEGAVYAVWKAVASFAPLIMEDIRRQTNAIPSAAPGRPDTRRAEQAECLDLTGLFKQRFSEQVPEGGLPAQAPTDGADSTTNAPPLISAETRQKILELAAEAEAFQDSAVKALDESRADDTVRDLQARAYSTLIEILKLLPPQQQQQQSNEQKEEQQEKQDQQDSGPDRQEEEKQEEAREQQQEENQADKKPETPEDVKQMLQRALQREAEKEQERRSQNEHTPLSPHERDW